MKLADLVAERTSTDDPVGALAVMLARRLDEGDVSPREAAELSRELRQLLKVLEGRGGDPVNELLARFAASDVGDT